MKKLMLLSGFLVMFIWSGFWVTTQAQDTVEIGDYMEPPTEKTDAEYKVFAPDGTLEDITYAGAQAVKDELNVESTTQSAITWTFSNGTLKISGSGKMADCTWNNLPWEKHRNSIKKVVIGEGITSIGACAFYEVKSLTTVQLPSTLTMIGNFAFVRCENLQSIDLPVGLMTIGQQAFESCTSLKKIFLPKNLIWLGSEMFARCTSLTSVYFDGSNTETSFVHSGGFFAGCTSLENIQVSDKHILFSSVNGVLYSDDGSMILGYPSGKKDTTFRSPASVKTIFQAAFDENNHMEHFIGNEGLEIIDTLNFHIFKALKTIELPSTLTSKYALGSLSDVMEKIVNKSSVVLPYTNYMKFNKEADENFQFTLYSQKTGKEIKNIAANDTTLFKVKLEKATLSKSSYTMSEGDTIQLKPTYTPKYASDKSFTWTSDRNSVATVSSSGKITAKKAGTANIKGVSNVNSKITLKATVKVAARYKVSFDANGGRVSTSSKKVGYQEKYGTLPNPSRKGHKFAGWYTEKSAKRKITAKTVMDKKKSTTLYAKWDKISVDTTQMTSVTNNKSKQMNVKWKKAKNVDGYLITIATDKAFKNNVSTTTINVKNKTSATIKKLTKGRRYYVKVQAFKVDSANNMVNGKCKKVMQVTIRK